MPDTDSIRIGDQQIAVEPVKPLPGGGAQLDLNTSDGRTWRIDVTAGGTNDGIVMTWRDETLADFDEPDWLDDVLARVANMP